MVVKALREDGVGSGHCFGLVRDLIPDGWLAFGHGDAAAWRVRRGMIAWTRLGGIVGGTSSGQLC